MEYIDFLKTKQMLAVSSGFEIEKTKLNPLMFDWQKDIVKWALKKGKAALFEDCGMGKTIQQLEFAKQVNIKTDMPVLILAPLAVGKQTQREGLKFGYEVNICRDQSDVKNGINITNYEIVEHFKPDTFSGVVLDESSILKSYTSSTKNYLTEAFRNIPYKLCCTATPSPNDFTELGNHSEFLNIMSRTEMLATFFVHDGGSTSDWRLKGHAAMKFFEWVASWACCITSPADLGYDGTDYQLPELKIIEHIVKSDKLEDEDGQQLLCANMSMSLSQRRQARKDSAEKRTMLAAEIANSYNGQSLVWCDYNDESTMLKKYIKNSVEVKGSDSSEHKTNAMIGFSEGSVKCLVSKPKIAGWGMNWQNCDNIIFSGLSDSFESFYQAIRRCWRFGQKKPVTVHIITSEAEGAVKQNIERKQSDAEKMKMELIKYTKDILKSNIRSAVRITETYHPFENITVPQWLGGKTS